MSFQISVLKILAGLPEGRASVAELTRCVSILISSGTDWTNRTKRLAARAPKLDIFADSFVRTAISNLARETTFDRCRACASTESRDDTTTTVTDADTPARC
jgi:hypothetical protein